MSWSDLTRDQKVVTVMTVLTALMHVLFAGAWTDFDVFGINLALLFVINGIGYFVLLYLLYFGDQVTDKNMVRIGLGLWTLGSIVGYFMYHDGTVWDPAALPNKFIEIALLVFLYLDMQANGSGSAPAAAMPEPAAEATTETASE